MENAALAGQASREGGIMIKGEAFANPFNRVRKIIIRFPNWVGDAVMSLPAVSAVHRNFPTAEIRVLAKPWVADLFNGNSGRQGVLLYESPGKHQGLRGRWRLGRELKKEKFELGLLFTNSFDSAFVFYLAGIPQRAGYNTDGRGIFLTHCVPVNSEVKRVHQVGYYLHLLQALGLKTEGTVPRLKVAAEDEERGMKKAATFGAMDSSNWVGISPGAAYGSAKEWFPERYGELAGRLAKQYGASILMLGTSREREVGERVLSSAKAPIIDFTGKTTLGEAMAFISRCRVFITNDSGLMHVAAALGVPTVAIFGSTDPERTGPLGDRWRVIQKSVPCGPCLKPKCPQKRECMDIISVDEVFAEGEKLWAYKR